MIRVEELTYKVGNRKLVDGLSFEAHSGEMLAILGANGAGKSTLMKLLCREIRPSEGKVFIKGKELMNYRLEDLAKTRAVLSQHNTISVSFVVDELVMMGRYPHFDQK